MPNIQAVIFDYGLVLSGPPSPAAIEQILALVEIDHARFDELYWARRTDYDLGKLTGQTYWLDILKSAGRGPNTVLVDRLIELDGQVWLTENTPLLQWQSTLHAKGVRSAILSNMGDAVQRQIELNCPWINRFEVRVWSNTVHITKPDPRIYMYILDQLGVDASNAVFIDDRLDNCQSALALGIRAVQYTAIDWYSNLAALAPELAAHGLSVIDLNLENLQAP